MARTKTAAPADGVYVASQLSMQGYLDMAAWSKGIVAKAERRSWAYARWHDENPEPAEGPQTFGTAVHKAIEDPADFARRYAPGPRGDGRTAAVKDAKKAIEARGQVALDPDEYAGCLAIRLQLERHPLIGPMLEEGLGQFESTLVWTDPETGLRCRARPDWLVTERGLMLDWKTTRCVSDHAFERQVFDLGYDLGAAWYLRGAEILGLPVSEYVLVPILNDPPYEIRVRPVDDPALDLGREIIRRRLPELARCVETGEWPGLCVDVKTISTPNYAFDGYEAAGREDDPR